MDFLGQNVYDDKRNLTFFTRQNVEIVGKLYFNDEEILNTEIINPSTREGAVLAAKNEETINNIVATPSIREGTVLAVTVRLTVDNEETIRLKMVANSSIRKRAVLAAVAQRAAINEETTSEVEQSKYYKTSKILQDVTAYYKIMKVSFSFDVHKFNVILFNLF